MKKIFILGISLHIFLFACKSHENAKVEIKSKNDTIEIGNTYTAELHVNSIDSILPSFYIVIKSDTFRVPVDEIKKCGIFNAGAKIKGQKEYNGFVEYVNNSNINIKQDFSIKFYVQ